MAYLFPILAAGGLEGCEGGTSSETVGMDQGIIEATPGRSGIAVSAEPGISLGLYAEDFRPQANSGIAITATADSGGKFAFDQLPPGRYRLLARRAGDGKAALLSGLEVPSDTSAPIRGTLEPTGSLAGIITDSLNALMAMVYVPGTPFFAVGDSLMRYSLAGMPAGSYPIVKSWKQPLPCHRDMPCSGLESRQDSAAVRIRPGESAVW